MAENQADTLNSQHLFDYYYLPVELPYFIHFLMYHTYILDETVRLSESIYMTTYKCNVSHHQHSRKPIHLFWKAQMQSMNKCCPYIFTDSKRSKLCSKCPSPHTPCNRLLSRSYSTRAIVSSGRTLSEKLHSVFKWFGIKQNCGWLPPIILVVGQVK